MEHPPTDNFPSPPMEVVIGTIFLLGLSKSIFCFKKEGIRVFGLLISNLVIGICVFHVVLDEAQINFFVVNQKYRKKGYGTYLMNYLIKQCEILNINKLLLEVSKSNFIAEKFYSRFDFFTVGIRTNYYRDGSDAVLKEKKLLTK